MAIPTSASLTGASVTEGDFKSRLTELVSALNLTLGTGSSTQEVKDTLKVPLAVGTVSKSAAYTIVAADQGKLIKLSGAGWTLSVADAATLTDRFSVAVANTGSGIITLDPFGSQTVSGKATQTIGPGDSFILMSDGSNLVMVGSSGGAGAIVSIVAITTPGAYSVTTPVGSTSALVKVLAGGAVTAGGAYAEKVVNGLTPGVTQIAGVVGGSDQASTITSPVAVTCAAGGSAAGGDFNLAGFVLSDPPGNGGPEATTGGSLFGQGASRGSDGDGGLAYGSTSGFGVRGKGGIVLIQFFK